MELNHEDYGEDLFSWRGAFAFGMSEERDCHVFLIDGGKEMALTDAGAGLAIARLLHNFRFDGLDPGRIASVLLTHAHADHAGGAFEWHQRFGTGITASPEAAEYVKRGDDEKISFAIAKQGGFYPKDYKFHACPVAHVLKEGSVL